MKTILLTGFEPFLSYSTNPTMNIVQALHGLEIGEYAIHGEILPVEFNRAGDLLIEYIEKHEPDIVISLGLANGRKCITPERIAINVNDGPKDNTGHIPIDETIEADGADGYFTTLPIRKMVVALNEKGYPAKISNTAGAYVCNHIMYRALHHSKMKNNQMKSGFIHIPASHQLAIEQGNVPSWSEEDLKQAIIICLESLSYINGQ